MKWLTKKLGIKLIDWITVASIGLSFSRILLFLLQVIIVTTAVWVLTTNCFWTKPYIERLPQCFEYCNRCFRTSWSSRLIVLTSWNTTDILKVELSIFPITTYCYKYSPLFYKCAQIKYLAYLCWLLLCNHFEIVTVQIQAKNLKSSELPVSRFNHILSTRNTLLAII